MDVELYKRAQSIFDSVLDLPAGERQAALASACGDDVPLRELVDELLELEAEDSGQRLESIAAAAAGSEIPVALQPGVQVDRYVILRLLGRGGTAQVWEVMHRVLGSRQALKVLTWADPTLQRRLLREARAQATLVHPNIVPVHDIIEVHGAPGLLMPAIDGPALDELLEDYTPNMDEALSVFAGVVAGVAHAHEEGLVHRDLKPGNVLMDLQEGEVVPRVTDFGLVKGGGERTATLPGQVMGTLSYASPEQLRDTSEADARADLWSLGVMLVELVTGERPFRGRVIADILALHAEHNAHERVPESIRPVVERLLQVDPDQRAPSCAWVLDHLPPFSAGPHPGLLAACRSHARPPLTTVQMERDLHTLSAVLTPAPAQLVSEAPTTPTVHLPPEPTPPAQRSSAPWAIAAVALIVGGLGVFQATRPAPQPTVTEAPAPTKAPTPQVPAPEVPAPEPPDPEPAAPEPAPPKPAPPKPKPAPSKPEPPKVEPTPPPAPEAPPPEPEPPPAQPGRVHITGDATEVTLFSQSGQVHRPGAIPPGTYTYRATLPERGPVGPYQLGTIASGQTITIHCSKRFGSCKIQGR